MRIILSVMLMVGWLLITSNEAALGAPSHPMHELSVEDAATLAQLAVEHQIEHIKGHGDFSLDKFMTEPDERFYTFEALGVWSSEQGSAVIGRYAANRKNAEVWDVYAECRKVSFPALRRLQARYRRQFGLPNREPKTIPNHGQPPRLC